MFFTLIILVTHFFLPRSQSGANALLQFTQITVTFYYKTIVCLTGEVDVYWSTRYTVPTMINQTARVLKSLMCSGDEVQEGNTLESFKICT